MPGLGQSNEHYSSWFWSENVDGVSYNQLHKFWSELSLEARQELLKIDKQALFEQARCKNMCCSRCNGLLLEDFLQIVSYGKSAQEKVSKESLQCSKDEIECDICNGELQDPIFNQWGGLTTTRDGSLTFLDCYLYAKSFKELQTVFESARDREKERVLLYPYACGGRYKRRVCALHTMSLSCHTLVDFWSTLEDESSKSVLTMKEDDFIERLTFRFDRRKFCKDCRRNVIRELKGQQCVHSMLVVGDGYVSIKSGVCIQMLLEHAQEVEKEEDEVMLDKDAPQKHAKSPELAREFLQDAASVIFKEKVEKAYREGASRENAHSLFVCLSSKLLEQRLRIACKEVVTLENQKKLMEEEDRDKREEEERKERKRTKEREKKLRRKEKLKEKEQKNPKLEEETDNNISCEKSETETGVVDLSPHGSPDDHNGECMDDNEIHSCDSTDIAAEIINHEDENGWLTKDKPRHDVVHQTARFCKQHQPHHNDLRWSDKRRNSVKATSVNRYTQSDYRPRSKVTMELKHPLNSSNSVVSSVTCSTCKPKESEDVLFSPCKAAEANTMNIVDKAQPPEPQEHSSLKEADERKSNQMYPMETPTSRVPQTDGDDNFSLFHFSGPVARSNVSKSNPACSKDAIFGDFSLQFSGDHVFRYLTSNTRQKESIIGKEYNLFATSNSFSFTIF